MKFILDKIFFFLVFLYILMGAHAWPFWILEDRDNALYMIIVKIAGALICIVYIILRHIRLDFSRKVIVGLLFLFLAFENVYESHSIFHLFVTFCMIMPLWVLLSLRELQESILRFSIRSLSIILLLGLPLHIYILNNGLLPGIPIQHSFTSAYYFFNYIFLLEKPSSFIYSSIPRFQSVFLEPGYLAPLIVFLLYAIKYNLKKYKSGWILLASLLFSLSLVGIITCLVGYIAIKWSHKGNITYFIFIGLFVFAIYLVAQSYNDGKNIINEYVFERLVLDKDKGIEGNNRTGRMTDVYFEQALSNGDFLFGLGGKKIENINGGKGSDSLQDFENQIVGAGYKIFILYQGVIGIVFYFVGYFKIGIREKINRRFLYGFLLIILLTFIPQGCPDSYSWLIPFILGTAKT